ncbi:hypothetical protein POM88_008601 [Heracleum sosnowskyi]|uniref:Uncharacterized protein n=1 Tax=Heracleum sosnowskyi TaxID=360622 RepID=A0AAD8J7H9_9APIA|nr:hypothetical protein POM88_008601 [Heracleum sosnowskyi]
MDLYYVLRKEGGNNYVRSRQNTLKLDTVVFKLVIYNFIKFFNVIEVDENPIVDVTVATVPVDHGNISFDKNKLLWRVAESLEAFSIMPQKPHFQPLESFSEIHVKEKLLI